MPISFAKDTGKALGEFARECHNRSLLQQRFVFCDDSDVARRMALDEWVNGGSADLEALAAKAGADAVRRAGRHGDRDEQVQAWRSLKTLAQSMAAGLPRWQVRLPDRSWLGQTGFHLITRQRLAIGLANGAWENTGLTLHRRFGYPLIPGSAVKGLARRGAEDLKAEAGLYRVVLGDKADPDQGTEAHGGAVSFLDAVAEEATVELDIVTPHYPRYYAASSSRPNPVALDDEPPVPNVFPVVAAGARFRFDLRLLRGRDPGRFTASQILDAAKAWLTHALSVLGAGAKTRSGYGRFAGGAATIREFALFPASTAGGGGPTPAPAPQLAPAEACLARWRGRVPTFGFQIPRFVTDLAALPAADQHRVARELIAAACWDAAGRPANPATSPFWKEFAKATGGAELLARLAAGAP